MLEVILLVVCLIASAVGSIVGAGGGVIIKPVLDMIGVMPIATVSFCSGCTVLAMSISSMIRTRKQGVKLEVRESTMLGIGAVAGGLLGQVLFDWVKSAFGNDHILAAVQAIVLNVVMVIVLLYVCFKKKIKSYHFKNPVLIIAIGLVLGLISAFLGIGGGPLNIAVLFFFFSMDAKTAAKNSLFIIIFSQVASIVTSAIRGTIPQFDPKHQIFMIIGGVGGALIGAFISSKINNQGVEKVLKVLIVVIICIGIYNIVKNLICIM